MTKTYISIADLSARQNTSRRAIYDRIKADPTFPTPYKFSDKCTRFDLEEIEAWEASKRAKNAA
ncbi:helix-turn-helix transcriptional regulator [Seohaeicola nanhaiensis]|uniref:Helix-turn-helix transcriptional regulator n=1 Tax=Seohaeicola nanhaiensis TaxID=1387282 RepID=A0ABV9KNQ8_9RHOB